MKQRILDNTYLNNKRIHNFNEHSAFGCFNEDIKVKEDIISKYVKIMEEHGLCTNNIVHNTTKILYNTPQR